MQTAYPNGIFAPKGTPPAVLEKLSAAVRAAVALAVEQFGRLDIAFANAGIFGSHATVDTYPEDVFDQVMAVNVSGSFYVVKHAMAAGTPVLAADRPVLAEVGGAQAAC